MKSVALVGFADSSLKFAKDSKADEMWSVNFAWDNDVPRIDRLFEIHALWWLALSQGDRDKKHLEWLQKDHDFPIYTYDDYTKEAFENGISLDKVLEKEYRIPNSTQFPFEESYKLFALLQRENKPGQPYYTNTIAYMMALAIMEGFDRIELYGIEMSGGTEYAYQKACLEYFIGLANGRGIEVYLPEHCALMNARLYHKGANMISRQTIEAHVIEYEKMREENTNKNNFWRGQMALLKEQGTKEQELKDIMKNIQVTHERAFIGHAGAQACKNMLKAIDIENPVIELINSAVYSDPSPDQKIKQEKKENQNDKPTRSKTNEVGGLAGKRRRDRQKSV